jgi:hypothetical protein
LLVFFMCVIGFVYVCYCLCVRVLLVMYTCVIGYVYVCYWLCIRVLLVMYTCVIGIGLVSALIRFVMCFDRVVYFGFALLHKCYCYHSLYIYREDIVHSIVSNLSQGYDNNNNTQTYRHLHFDYYAVRAMHQ